MDEADERSSPPLPSTASIKPNDFHKAWVRPTLAFDTVQTPTYANEADRLSLPSLSLETEID
jgi:hypothetical protein